MADKTPKEIAQKGCDQALQSSIGKLTEVLTTCLATAATDAEKAECRARYKRGMTLAKEAHKINTDVIGEVFVAGVPPGSEQQGELASFCPADRERLVYHGLLKG